jgi:hypothetical protein
MKQGTFVVVNKGSAKQIFDVLSSKVSLAILVMENILFAFIYTFVYIQATTIICFDLGKQKSTYFYIHT